MNILNIYDGAGPVPTNYYCMVSSIKLPILVTEVMQRSEKQIPNSNTGSNAHFPQENLAAVANAASLCFLAFFQENHP